jgi:thiamine-monophosphate kinase
VTDDTPRSSAESARPPAEGLGEADNAGAGEGLGEFELIRRLGPFLAGAGEGVAVGSGDDAAVLDLGDRWVCLAVDVVVEDVHFRRDLSSLADVGWKAVAVNCSDIAAMGARPTAAVVGLCRPADLPVADVEELYTGMHEACGRWGLRLVGGDTVKADALALSVTVLGELAPGAAVRRSGGQPGNALVLVGALGAAAAALAQIRAGLRADEALLAVHRRPIALVEAGRVLAEGGATAMIDVSDGLGADLGHVCEASGVGAVVHADDLPVAAGVRAVALRLGLDPLELACGGGEDFALLAAVPADRAGQLAAAAGDAEGVPAAVIGKLVAPDGEDHLAVLKLADGTTRDLTDLGFDHYRGEA